MGSKMVYTYQLQTLTTLLAFRVLANYQILLLGLFHRSKVRSVEIIVYNCRPTIAECTLLIQYSRISDTTRTLRLFYEKRE